MDNEKFEHNAANVAYIPPGSSSDSIISLDSSSANVNFSGSISLDSSSANVNFSDSIILACKTGDLNLVMELANCPMDIQAGFFAAID